MQARRFIQCDVFTPIPTLGNALAVVVDGEGVSEESMRQFAAWTNLAETTFILPPQDLAADYKLRIFSPTREMLFAGHPTLGSCAAWLHCGGKAREPGIVRQECGVGIVPVAFGGLLLCRGEMFITFHVFITHVFKDALHFLLPGGSSRKLHLRAGAGPIISICFY